MKNVVTNFNEDMNHIYIAENEQNGEFRFSIWKFEKEKLDLEFISEISDTENCEQVLYINVDDINLIICFI